MAKIRGLYCKSEGSFLLEERKAIFCTLHEESFYFILNIYVKKYKRTGSEIRKLRAFKDSDCMFGVSEKNMLQELVHSRTAGTERVNFFVRDE